MGCGSGSTLDSLEGLGAVMGLGLLRKVWARGSLIFFGGRFASCGARLVLFARSWAMHFFFTARSCLLIFSRVSGVASTAN